MREIIRLTSFLAVCLCLAPWLRAEVVLPKILGDHMVLQRGMDARIWGKAAPGEKIKVSADWQWRKVVAIADQDGRWSVRMPTPAPGGPHTIRIQGENEIVLRDVLIGEVWLCSGQSNMEMPVGDYSGGYNGVVNWQEELHHTDFPTVRLFTVANGFATSPQFDCEGRWSQSNADTAKAFSAAGFFFGRELSQKLNVPIGLVSADFGGTVAEAWTSESTLKTMPDFAEGLKLVTRARDGEKELEQGRATTVAEWLKRIELADGGADNAAFEFDDASWSLAQTLGTWTGDLAGFAGFAWFRKTILLPAGWESRDLVLELGPVDDMDFAYVNGAKIGQTLGEQTWNTPRAYLVPHALLKAGKNVISVRVLNTGGVGGISGPARLHPIGTSESLPLDQQWRYKMGANIARLPQLILPARLDANTPSVLFNAMLSPLIPLGIRGAIWYQGESNIGREEQYRRLFPAMIGDWRKHWDEGDFPFYYVQIAPFHYPNPGMSSALREAQLLSLSTPNTGMAVTMDSDSNNLHPHTKQAVGHRLALWALAKTYGYTNLVYSGPLYKAMKIEGNKVRLFFDHIGGGLSSGGKPLEHFIIAGADGKFVEAQAEIDGDTIVVANETVSRPVAVRYCWADTDESSFGNREGLPASSFRTDAPVPDR